MKIFVSAANGFLGSSLVQSLSLRGHELSGSQRRPQNKDSRYIILALGDEPPKKIFKNINVVIHTAHDFTSDLKKSKTINIEGTKKLFNRAFEAGVAHQIYLSSYSANPMASSNYGKIKYELEQFFLEKKQSIVRPGLVVGAGGLCYKNIKIILKTPVMPLIDGGEDFLPLISLDNFTDALAKIIEDKLVGEFNLFNDAPTSLGDFIKSVNHEARHSAIYLNIPSSFIIKSYNFLSKVGLPAPFSIENIQGLKMNAFYPHKSDLNTLTPHVRTLEDMIKRMLVLQPK